MMKVTPYPSTLETPSTWITLRSPDSVVSDSLGHENEVDISISSEEKTSATGSNVAPRSMGSEFSPTRKEGTKGSFSLRFTVIGAVCAVHLGVRSVVVDNEDQMVGRGLGQGKDRQEREKGKHSMERNQHFNHELKSFYSLCPTSVPLPFSSPGRGLRVVSVRKNLRDLRRVHSVSHRK